MLLLSVLANADLEVLINLAIVDTNGETIKEIAGEIKSEPEYNY